MRILHTSDWHLGRSFGPIALLDDQRAFIDWLVTQVREREVDLVVVAGDLFDRPVAPSDALVLFRNTLLALQELRVQVALITGNHDGPDRVANYHDLLDASGVYLRGGYTAPGEVIALQFADGPLQLVPLPYLDPQLAPDDLGSATVNSSDSSATTGDEGATGDADAAAVEAAYARRVRRTHQSVLADAIEAAKSNLQPGVRSLAVSHAYVLGATTSESERNLTVGGHGEVEGSLFEPFSYTALGHLHRPQWVGDSGTSRYSGTPLAYSFGENHAKSITIVDMSADGSCTVEEVPVPVGRGVHTVRGKIDDLLRATPTEAERQSFVRVELHDHGVVLDAKQRLSDVFPYVVEILLRPEGVVEGGAVPVLSGERPSPLETTVAFWREADRSEPTSAEQALLGAAVAYGEGVSA